MEMFNPKRAIPVDFEPDNVLFVVPTDDVVAVFRRAHHPAHQTGTDDESEGLDDMSEYFDSDDSVD